MLHVGVLGIILIDHHHLASLAVVVLHEIELLVTSVEHPTFVKGNGTGMVQPIEKNRRLVVNPITVGVFMDRNPTDHVSFARAVSIKHVASHLDNPHPALFIKSKRQRALHVRLVNHRA